MRINFHISTMIFVIFLALSVTSIDTKSVPEKFHSDIIVTHWPTSATEEKLLNEEEQEPGWMRQQLMRFGRMASRVGNAMGTHASKITAAIDKVCEVVKTVIPVLAAVCHVGQFKFCSATTGGDEINQALAPNPMDLNIQD